MGLIHPIPALAMPINCLGVEHVMTDYQDSSPHVNYKLVRDTELYRVGDDGSLWSRATRGGRRIPSDVWKRIVGSPLARGHIQVTLGGRRDLLHRIVLETFVGPCPPGMECRHLDGDPSNNRLSNLAWGTRLENSSDTVRHGRSMRGHKHHRVKLSEDIVRSIMSASLSGMTRKDIVATFGVNYANVHAILYGVSWSHVTGIRRYVPKRNRKENYVAQVSRRGPEFEETEA